MSILFTFLYSLFASIKVIIQSKYTKKNINFLLDTLVFWGFIFLIVGISFLVPALINETFKYEILIFGLIYGLFTYFYQLFYTLALKEGSTSLSAFIVSISSILNILFGVIVFNDKLTHARIAAFVLFFLALLFTFKLKDNKGINKKWLLYISITSISLIICNIVSKFASNFAAENNISYTFTYLSVGYSSSGILSILTIIPLLFKKEKISIKPNKEYFGYSICIGLILLLVVFLNQYTLSLGSFSVISTLRGCLTAIISILMSLIFFKEKTSKNEVLGIISGLLAICLVNF